MEYMANGKPIVAFDLKETHFSAGDAAVTCEPTRKRNRRNSCRANGSTRVSQEMGARGRRRVEEELQWNKVGGNLLTASETFLAKA